MSFRALFGCIFVCSLVLNTLSVRAQNSGEIKKGVISANRLNVRVRPSTRFTAVASLKRGQEVTLLEKKDGWYRIPVPENTEVWIASPFIKDGVAITKINMRAGPSVAYASFGTLDTGTKVKIEDSSRENWLRIAPPEGLTAWISADYVFIPSENKSEIHHVKAVSAVNPPAKTASSVKEYLAIKRTEEKNKQLAYDEAAAKTPAAAAKTADNSKKTKLPFIPGEEKNVTVEGILLPLNKVTYVSHAIATRVNKEFFPVCYIHSDRLNLKLWEKKRIRVQGKQRWVKGWKRPIVEIEKITPTWQ